jgi:hypothetical protein
MIILCIIKTRLAMPSSVRLCYFIGFAMASAGTICFTLGFKGTSILSIPGMAIWGAAAWRLRSFERRRGSK